MRLVRSVLAIAMGVSGCADLDVDPPAAPADRPGALLDYRTRAARDLAISVGDGARRDALVAALRAGPVAIGAAPDLGIADFTGFEAVPELWLHEPAGSSLDDLVVAYAPAGEEATWSEVPAFAPGGDPVALDAIAAPSVPVIVVETHGRLAFRRGIAEANRTLAALGMQRAPAAAKAVGRMTVRLDQIRITDDQEPWVSGAAEVYAIGSGVIGDNEPQLRIVELPYLDYAGTTYTPRQIILDWNDYAFQAANLQLFEHDDSTSYQTLVVELVAAVGAIGSLAGYPAVQAVTEIASRIVAAMPAGWFSNDDDYLDSFYTLEKNVSYGALPGAARNATVTLVPYYLAPN
jgi:hypothetical protein